MHHAVRAASKLGKILRENGLTLVLVALFLITMAGQIVTGFCDHNDDQREHGRPTLSLGAYLVSGHFIEATAENWESEFLQMAMFVLLTVHLYQKGSPESKSLEGKEDVDEDPRLWRHDPRAPWPVRKGGVILWLYSHSLSLTFLLLFVLSFVLHAFGGAKEYTEQQLQHGLPGASMLQFMGTSRFWFESFQNWESEFLSVFAIVILSIFLREKSSPQSKPVDAPDSETGG